MLSHIKTQFATAFSIKGVEANRAPLPRGGYVTGGGNLYATNEFGEILDAMKEIGLDTARIDFRKEAGDFRQNSIVGLCQNWIGTSFPQAPPRLGRYKDGKIEAVAGMDDHPMLSLLRRPNPNYTGKWLSWALTDDWFPSGDAYGHIVTNGRTNLVGEPVEVEWLPSDLVSPMADRTGRLSYFQYDPGTGPIALDPKEIVHFRFGIDRLNPLRGASPLLPQMRFIAADNAGAAYSAGLLINGGIPPALLVPETVSGPSGLAISKTLDPATAEELTETLSRKFKDNPGKVRFLSNAVKLLMLGYKPSEMALNELLEEPETRIPAAYGIPPEVLKVRVGLMHSTENNIEQARKAAWQDCLAPCQDYFAEAWTTQLLVPRYGDDSLVLFYDRSEIGVLQPDMSALRADAAKLYEAGVIDRAAAKTMIKEAVNKARDEGHYAGDSATPATDTAPAGSENKVDAEDLSKRANAVGILVRSGFVAESAAQAAGLPDIDHTGLLPVTLQSEEAASGVGDAPEETPKSDKPSASTQKKTLLVDTR